MIDVREPRNKKEIECLYKLRWIIMRKPWNQPRGSEKDELEDKSWNVIALDGKKVVGTARLHKKSETAGQIRFMCVDEEYRKRGIGKKMIDYLHEKAKAIGLKKIVADVRESAKEFYLSKGYNITGRGHTLFGEIKHFKMERELT